MQKKSDNKNLVKIFLVFIFLYVLLFEFALPLNKILPKPSMLWESIPALFSDYNLLYALAVTTSAIYGSLILGYLIIHLIAPLLIKILSGVDGVYLIPRLFRYFTPLFFALLFIFWFEDSFIAEIIFGLLTTLFILGGKLYKEIPAVKEEYILFAKSLKIDDGKIFSSVAWKSCQPKIFSELKSLHLYLWAIILVYEFAATVGVGGVYKFASEYHDLSAIVALGILVSIIIWLVNMVIGFLERKIIYWES